MAHISTDRQKPATNRSASRCRRHPQSKTMQRPSGIRGHGFLTHRFTPVMNDTEGWLRNRQAIETGFFNSLANFCQLYECSIVPNASHPFPLNLVMAYKEAKWHLKECTPGLELMILSDAQHLACLATIESLSTGSTLYYIPVRPFVDLLQKKNRKKESALLTSLLAYLYKVVDIPWFIETGSYLDNTYECLETWMVDCYEPEENEEENDYYAERVQCFTRMREEAPAIETLLQQPKHLRQFEQRLKTYHPTDSIGGQLKEVAQDIWQLYKKYPTQSILNSVPENLFSPEAEERIRIDHYISFFWDSEDEVYDTLMEHINVDLQECGAVDEPASIQLFDQPQTGQTHSLDFEKQLFPLICDVCKLLNELA